LEDTLITPEKIDEWIHEAEERPSSASLIIRFIGNRLNDLTKWNDELQAENLALRTEKKVEEFEKRIATLEYQIGLLKRQLGGEVVLPEQLAVTEALIDADTRPINLLIYNPLGQVLRFDMSLSDLAANKQIGNFSSEVAPANLPVQLLVVHKNEEMLFVFDSGRTISMPVTSIPVVDNDHMDWQQAYLQPPLGTEELAILKPVGRMALSDYCVQVSRKGCVKKIKESLFETYLGKSYIGTGIKSTPDKTCELVLCHKADRLVLVSKEGFLQCIEVDPLPSTIEEVIRLGITDHIITTFATDQDLLVDHSLVFITKNGKVIQRKPDWIELANSFKTKGQAVFSQERREAGVRLVATALVKEDAWGVALHSDGGLVCHQVRHIIDSGTLLSGDSRVSILGFAIYHPR
jgi:DNA gyrase/topoisomerase IV subunit A